MNFKHKLFILQALEETILRHKGLVRTETNKTTVKIYQESVKNMEETLKAFLEENPEIIR